VRCVAGRALPIKVGTEHTDVPTVERTMPRSRTDQDAVLRDLVDQLRPARGPIVLVAEDEPGVRALVAAVLRGLGLEVIAAGDGVEALAASAEAPVRLLVTDVDMPRMDGRELAARMRERAPDLPTLFVSGYAGGSLAAAGDPATAFLPKPFRSAELADAVRALLPAA